MKRDGSGPRLGGCNHDPRDGRDYRAANVLSDGPERAISYRPAMLPPRNQLGLGACVAFAVTACREAMEAVARPERMPQEQLSVLDLYKHTKRLDPWPNSEGTSLRFAMKVLQKVGQAQESACRYSTEFPPRRRTKFWGHAHRRYEKVDSYYRINSVEQGRAFLREHGPWVLGVPVAAKMGRVDGSQVLEIPDTSEIVGGHALAVCGCGERGFEVKNSWGQGWRDGGYAVLPYEYIRLMPWWDGWGFIVGDADE